MMTTLGYCAGLMGRLAWTQRHGLTRLACMATDSELLRLAQRGDKRALEQVLRDNAPRIARFAARMCATQTQAEDVTQDTLVAVSQGLGAFRQDSALPTWLYQIARRFCQKQQRRGRSVRQAEVSLDDGRAPEALALLAEWPEPGDALDAQRMSERVGAALAELRPTYREVLVLRDVEGLTAPEVAQMLGLQVATVKTRLHRARLELRAALQPSPELAAPTG